MRYRSKTTYPCALKMDLRRRVLLRLCQKALLERFAHGPFLQTKMSLLLTTRAVNSGLRNLPHVE